MNQRKVTHILHGELERIDSAAWLGGDYEKSKVINRYKRREIGEIHDHQRSERIQHTSKEEGMYWRLYNFYSF